MLVWINGPFGGGKTQTAHELHRRLPGSVLSDPEIVGFGLQRMLPRRLRGDFQDLPAWRQGVFETLDLVLGKQDGAVVVPMTLVEPPYFEEIIGRLRERGHDVRHFALLAERETVLRRLSERDVVHLLRRKGMPPKRESFAVSKLDLCLERLSGAEFGEHIHTDGLTVAQVADRIAASAGLTLEPNTDGALRGFVRRKWTSVKHIRFG
ncbi:AAA family ATPase [Amycolatopsis pittospori]|uniref:AAA family ATPase n=1 Tax=Amycolatopsis pittospori TaxID=2749434 RepID=UPI0015F03364|nr:AAA family ATPase [Amycolatopsis pittospori]